MILIIHSNGTTIFEAGDKLAPENILEHFQRDLKKGIQHIHMKLKQTKRPGGGSSLWHRKTTVT